MLGYRVPAPDDAMLISGGKHGDGVPFRVVVGRGAFVLPGFRKVRLLTLAMQEAQVDETCITQTGISLDVKAVIAFKVGNDNESIINAGQRFIADENQMPVLIGRIFAGHLRSIVGAMTVEDIIKERQKLAEEVLDASKIECAKIGLVVDSLQIQSIDDLGSGYIKAMGQVQRAAIQQQAAVAQAQADQNTQIAQALAQQKAVEAQQQSAQQQSNFAAETARVQAQNQAAVETAQAEASAKIGAAKAQADAQMGTAQAEAEAQVQVAQAKVQEATARAAQAGPLAQAQASQQVAMENTKLAEQNAKLRQQQLLADVVRPAEADAQKVAVTAKAEAERTKIMAEAAAAGSRISLDQQLISQLPAIVQAASAGLAGSNLTVLNGSEGLGELITGLVGQGAAILATVKESLPGSNGNGSKSKEMITK